MLSALTTATNAHNAHSYDKPRVYCFALICYFHYLSFSYEILRIES
ncbi:Hypothetical protein BN2458_PEG0271 [Helicobacter typhlonius]|uniref:Uncharacterized protein n=1 Tax=Helicobacter typhlonius TaxID=76936 RepID=A0A0S4PTU3_9HELI|nr:Hypothetical protein BN2458_PEG0271 [Helicobacter typhlonius]